ncbi:uncharacterized protein LOC130815207 isoform X1 [Amaranthus tricolor]|uniref:uncharacterized protein LOC130815207 isoform X1 n=1 Tax=Amaranthus tricolor TaxID=29722 RepID=UPI00258D49D6|nr:uncharacterized protein LOC130815207 isoform X1 [Amaranthus tricolor]
MSRMKISNMHTNFILNLCPPLRLSSCISCKSTDHPSPSLSNNSNIEIRVCTNRTCRKQGSHQILETLIGISPSHVSINPCGCLGRCGSGPNLVVLPPAAIINHCGTAARAAQLMVDVCGVGDNCGDLGKRSLDALALRKRAENEFQRQNFSEAEALFSQAVEAHPIGGIHIAYKGRSAARLALGNFSGALEDAKEAIVYAPNYAEGYICQGDVFLAMDQLEAAEESYGMALETDPALRHSKGFKARIQALQEKMASTTMSN